MQAHEYDQIRAIRDQTIESWQLEDALNALKQTESLIASLENNHAREAEQLHTSIAALEHTTKQRQTEVEQLEQQLREQQEQTEQQLAAANFNLKKMQAARVKETRHAASENGRLRGLIKSAKRHIELQASTLAELDHLCDRRAMEIEDSQQTVRTFQKKFDQLKAKTTQASQELQKTVDRQSHQLDQQLDEIDKLTEQCSDKENELTELVRVCDQTEAKLAKAIEEHGREAAHLQLTVNRLQNTLREQQTRANDLQQQRDDLENELSVRLDELNIQSQEKLEEAKHRYESQFGNLHSKIENLESLVSDRASQVQQLSSTLVSLKDEHAKEISSTQQSAEQAVAATKDEYQAEVQQLSSTIVQLKDVHQQEIASTQETAQQQVESAMSRFQNELQQLQDDHAREIASTRASADQAAQLLKSEHQAEVQRLQSVMGSLEQAFEANISEKRSFQARAEDLQRKCESLEKNTGEASEDRAAQVKKLEQSIRAGQERIKNEKLKQVKKLKVEVAELKKQLAAKSGEDTHFKHEARRLAKRLSGQLARHARTRDYLYQRIATLQNELQQAHGNGRAAA